MREQGQGGLRQRGRTSWELKFDLGRDPLTGKRNTRTVTFRGTKREAQAELTRLLNQKNEGTYVDPTKMTVGEWLEHWVGVAANGWATKTAARHRQIVRNNMVPGLGAVPLRALRATHIEAFEADLQREGYLKGRVKKGRGLSAQTVLHVHRTLSQALTHAVNTEMLFKNPAKQVRAPRPQDREIVILTKPEIARVLREAEGTQLAVPVLVDVVTGLRQGELFGLRWSDVDLAKGRLTVNQSLEYVRDADGKPRPQFKSGKTKTSRPTLTLPALAVEALRRHRREQGEARLRLGLGRAELVFTREDGSPASVDYETKAFGLLINRAKVTRITFHGLRHTHIRPPANGRRPRQTHQRAGRAHQRQCHPDKVRCFPPQPGRCSRRGDQRLARGRIGQSRWQVGLAGKGTGDGDVSP
jgi:integrase